MRVTLERSNLLRSLSHVHRVVERRNTIAILSNVLLTAEGDTLRLKATDLDLEVTESVQAMVEQTGETTVPAHLLHDIVRKMPDGAEVMLSMSGVQALMTVSAGKASFQLQCLPKSDFPELAAGDFDNTFRIPADHLKTLINRTQFAISNEETRYYLNGIYLHGVTEDGGPLLRAVATDGHRLARAEVEAPTGAEDLTGIIIPRKTVGEIQKLVEEDDAPVTVDVSPTKIRLTFGSVVLTSKLIDGTFPDYQRVIPTGNDKHLLMDCSSFQKAVDRVSTISAERGRAVKLTVEPGQVTLNVNNPGSGSATEDVAADYDAESLEIGFNAKYLLDITGQVTGENIKLAFADHASPTVIRDSDSENVLYVLMPMRV